MIEKIETMMKIRENGIIAVIRSIPEEKVSDLADVLISSGIKALEITVENKNALSIIEYLSNKYDDQIIIGAGTVLDSTSAKLAISKGADFILSPNLNTEVVKTTLRYGKVSIPGVMTPTEMLHAIENGADMVKVFPASVLGTNFIKDVKGPFPHIPIIPTGGINLDNVKSFIEAGSEAVGIGGSLINKDAINRADFDSIKEIASQYVQEVKKARISLDK
ncbi:2-dehydro-3-deoxyphosphogluconate aldolase [Virgibacillus profundi]|uniref:2-dehydro-3-deoxyphosphogluconate aldolase n=1 Tax=Virgibacillus profundi TaxID=2024555 RepID=A0A2A2I9L0_9BACI|nr:bifunctional 4-hydroxy-2-oxoglutarate aldolase/2-dehydro-3-deoxy-phosphogluconate aldolase [Virgibacillus profundi]PAV28327.1 2-dehydro-3-deoxyphosphogluconate aldolase [Virgibacillus profundi]PXY52311.1 2-dehydro-3-deoxyphosphogluconate aldolase [Virgibacillus profundi]